MDAQEFRAAMRRLASGVSLIATQDAGERHGLIATAVSSVTADPPTILICVNRNASIRPHLDSAGIFCVNLLAETQRDIALRFTQTDERETRFTMGDWSVLDTGAPVLQGALASLDCRVAQVTDYGSHRLYFGTVAATAVDTGAPPLLYHDGSFCGIALPPEIAAQ